MKEKKYTQRCLREGEKERGKGEKTEERERERKRERNHSNVHPRGLDKNIIYIHTVRQ
jgi:hypothetical protein